MSAISETESLLLHFTSINQHFLVPIQVGSVMPSSDTKFEPELILIPKKQILFVITQIILFLFILSVFSVAVIQFLSIRFAALT